MASTSSRTSKTELAKKHIEEIRRHKFSIGEKTPNPLVHDLHNAVANLSSELYTKDVHFIMELIQNAEDNEYPSGVEPSLEFVLTTVDVTGLGAPATLLVFNNEVGFSKQNIESLCSIGRSTKKGHRNKGFIGEKGIGFKSVFLVSKQPYIFSNGYQIRFSEVPNQDCGIGYIVPEWVATTPTISALKIIYGSVKLLPATTIILPLKPDKMDNVKKHLSDLHPEVLLFLRKIRRLSVREKRGSSPDSISEILISSETNISSSRTQGVDSRVVHLSSQEGSQTTDAACCYYIYRQVFPVEPGRVVDSRRDVSHWTICLAFPSGDRLRRGASSVGIFSFLPTSMVTNFPFIVQADFILASSREAILLDNKWNLGILDKVPTTFIDAIMTCLPPSQMNEKFPIAHVLEFFPTQESPVKQLNQVRGSIQSIVKTKCVVPCESLLTKETIFCKPADVVRIPPTFRKILLEISTHVPLRGITSLGKFILLDSVDKKYEEVWNFLGVPSVIDCYDWCGKCIKTCNLILRASPEVYMELLSFVSMHWKFLPQRKSIPLLKYIGWDKQILLCSVSQIKRESLTMYVVWEKERHSWLNKWNVAMGCPSNMFFVQDDVVTAILGNYSNLACLKRWLTQDVGVVDINVSVYCSNLCDYMKSSQDSRAVIHLAHLVYHSTLKDYIGIYRLPCILENMPVVEKSGNLSLCPRWLVPASRSKWAKLFNSSKFFTEECQPENCHGSGKEIKARGSTKYVELGDMYAETAEFVGASTQENELLSFFLEHGKASDLPDILPPDKALDVASNPLSSDQGLLLLEWVKNLKTKQQNYQIPRTFLESIQNGKWIKTYSGFGSPKGCYLYDGAGSSGTLADIGKALKILSAIDEKYYQDRIRMFINELRFIGVQVGTEEMYQLIVSHLKSLLSTAVVSGLAGISLLRLVRYGNENNKLNVELLKTFQDGKWLKTDRGFVPPSGVLYMASDIPDSIIQITDLKVVDKSYYGSQMSSFVHELKLLGALVNLEDVYALIPKHFKLPPDISKLTKGAVFLLLDCLRKLGSASAVLKEKLRSTCWIRTSAGFRCPKESLLSDPKWGILCLVAPFPVIDESFYGERIRFYKAELEALGVSVNLDQAFDMLIAKVKLLLSSGGLTSEIVVSLLRCMQFLRTTTTLQLSPLISCFSGQKWLKTRHGYRAAGDSILSDSGWATVSRIIDLPLIDDAFYSFKISSFKDELKMLGVVISLTEGAHFVARGLQLAEGSGSVRADCAISLLHCARSLRESSSSADKALLENFLNKLKGSKWLKTHMGYRIPEACLLFNPAWNAYLEEQDAPFIDQGFYGTLSSLELDELKAIGVKTDVNDICASIYRVLTSHNDTEVILRLYKFLQKYPCSLSIEANHVPEVWIPGIKGREGKWVDSLACILHDRDNLFDPFFHVLDKYYGDEILSFISRTFDVDEYPSICRYVDLWNVWVNLKYPLTSAKLCSFWGYISDYWNPSTEEILKSGMTMLPATTITGTVQLVHRADLCIADDLQLKKAFMEASELPLFVWFPQNSSYSFTKQYEIYRSLGIRKLSESAQLSVNSNFEILDKEGSIMGMLLIKIVLAFLASPRISMSVEERHRKVKYLVDMSVFGTDESLMVSYTLHLPASGKRLHAEVKKLALWDKSSGSLKVHKPSWRDGASNVEFIFDFARAMSEAVLPNASDLTDELCKIIKLGFAFGLKEDKVDLLLVTENLELFTADKDFLNCNFRAASLRRNLFLDASPCTPETSGRKKQRVGRKI